MSKWRKSKSQRITEVIRINSPGNNHNTFCTKHEIVAKLFTLNLSDRLTDQHFNPWRQAIDTTEDSRLHLNVYIEEK